MIRMDILADLIERQAADVKTHTACFCNMPVNCDGIACNLCPLHRSNYKELIEELRNTDIEGDYA